MDTHTNGSFAVFCVALVLVASLAVPGSALAGDARTAEVAFNDIADQPADVQRAIVYSATLGYVEGYADGSFHPNDAASRLDCARALVTVFGHAGEAADPAITFKDLPSSDPGYRWANLAVKHGLMDRRSGDTFAPGEGVLFEQVAVGVTAGKGMDDVASNLTALTGGAPPYGGPMAVFMDLHLKYRYSRIWPGKPYPRGELAYTLYRIDNVESWRPWYIRESFNSARCALPAATDEQFQAVSFGFQRLGCPYLYGGETEAEGGFDCSGFVYNTLSIRMGYPMMRVADDQARDNRYLYVDRGALQPGDAIFFYEDDAAGYGSYIGHAGMYVGNGVFIHSTGSNAGVSFDCLDNNDYWGTHLAWGRRVLGGPYNDRFDTWLLLYNPSPEERPVDVRFLRPAREPQTQHYDLAPHSRFTLPVDLLYPWDEVSMEVIAPGSGVVAERAMYFDYQDWADGGHASTGSAEVTRQGYFAEGYTGDGFDTYLLLANPEDEAAEVEVCYLREGVSPVVRTYDLAPSSRFTVLVDEVPGVGKGGVGISFRSLNGVKVAAERAMYFDYRGKRGGTCSPAIEEASQRLYLAEGYTGRGFDTWILLANPNGEAAEVSVTYLLEGGETVREKRTVPGRSRLTINAGERVPDRSFGVTIESTNGVGLVAERAMYFDYGSIDGGHCSSAQARASRTLYLAEGYTGGEFDTWILLANPDPEAAKARITFSREDGTEIRRDVAIPSQARFTLKADEVQGLEGCSFSTRVDSDRPLLMERSMYFFYQDRSGGTNCPAVEGPTPYRFFAEGYTGG